MKAKNTIIRSCRFILFILLLIVFEFNINAQITPNDVDTFGLKQGMWREFTIPINIMTDYVGFKVPIDSSEYIYLTKDRDRKYFPIVESIGEYKDGLKQGVWLEYYGNGTKKSQVEYKNGVPSGKCNMFWGNGVLKLEFTINENDSINVKAYQINGEFDFENKVLNSTIIKAIYEN